MAGEYFKIRDTPTFLRKDNLTRVTYQAAVPGTPGKECDGWVLETNTAAEMPVRLANCSDDLEAARLVIGSLGDGKPTMSDMKYPCKTLKDEGVCEPAHGATVHHEKFTNGVSSILFAEVVRGVCSFTCFELEEVAIGNGLYMAQNITTAYDSSGMDRYSCDNGDQIHAAEAFVRAQNLLPAAEIDALTEAPWDICYNFSIHEKYYNSTASPCHFHEWSRVWASLCAYSCPRTPVPQPPHEEPYIPDETSPEGALWQGRKLMGELPEVDRTSPEILVSWVEGHDDGTWEGPEMMTWMNGSWDMNSPASGARVAPDGSFVPGNSDGCPQGTSSDQLAFKLLDPLAQGGPGKLFFSLPPADPDV